MGTQRGNILFLILIAVALFAALSYAVTQVSRSSGGDASKETNLINSAWLADYTTDIISAMTRLTTDGRLRMDDVCFLRPSLAAFSTPANFSCNVFHPQGGNVPYSDLVAASTDLDGALAYAATPNVFVGRREIIGVGTTTGTAASAETMFIFSWVKPEVCRRINERLGLPDPSLLDSNAGISGLGTEASRIGTGNPGVVTAGNSTYDADAFGTVGFLPALSGQREACVMNNHYNFYYRVLVER